MSESPDSQEFHDRDYNPLPYTVRRPSIDEALQDAQDSGSRLRHLSLLNLWSLPQQVIRRTGIVVTIGPESADVDTLVELRKGGMNIIRLNFAQYTQEFHMQLLANLQESFHRLPGPLIAVAIDIKGPEIRTGDIESKREIEIWSGDLLELSTDERFAAKGNHELMYVDYKNLPRAVKPGSIIYIDEGLLKFTVTEIRENAVMIQAMNGGLMGPRKSVNIPEAELDLPPLSDQDVEDLRWGLANDVDIVFCHARKASDVQVVREAMGEEGKRVKLVAKVETYEGLKKFDEILSEAGGILVGRGDMGIEIPAEKVFLAQKMMLAKCNLAGKPSICAMQMLDSMAKNPRPTRAEISDVANAVLDGADCVMLSSETLRGNYPVQAVQMMHRVCTEAESAMFYRPLFNELINFSRRSRRHAGIRDTEETVAIAAVNAAYAQNAAAIICLTTSGRTAAYVSKYRPQCPVLTVTRKERVARQLHLYRSIFPMRYPLKKHEVFQDDVDSRIHWCI
eukprot:Ihof_evm3s6 gene=Ihof_evmTU3s6